MRSSSPAFGLGAVLPGLAAAALLMLKHFGDNAPQGERRATPATGDDGLTETADYCAAARIGMCSFRKRRTRSIVRCLSFSGSFHG